MEMYQVGDSLNLAVNDNGTLAINYSGEEWAGKICAIGIGWMIFWIPFFTGIYGVIMQLKLPKEITAKIKTLLVA